MDGRDERDGRDVRVGVNSRDDGSLITHCSLDTLPCGVDRFAWQLGYCRHNSDHIDLDTDL